jgi:hypothetical protein
MALFDEMNSDLDIVQLIYCSRSANFGDKLIFERDVDDILDGSRNYNLLHDITGALLTDGELFAQVIEGPSVAVKRLCSKIIRDGRHDRIVVLQHLLVHVRLFKFCPIAFSRVESILYARGLTAQSKPNELRKASVFVLKSLRPVLLGQL